MDIISFRQLQADNPADIAELQSILELAPNYHLLVEGKLPGPQAAAELMQDLPPGKNLSDKFVFAIHKGQQAIGCLELCRGYPDAAVAYIGLLLLIESEQGKALGQQALAFASQLAASWQCTRLRLAVIDTNERALAFWQKKGFSELYRKDMPAYLGQAVVLERVV